MDKSNSIVADLHRKAKEALLCEIHKVCVHLFVITITGDIRAQAGENPQISQNSPAFLSLLPPLMPMLRQTQDCSPVKHRSWVC